MDIEKLIIDYQNWFYAITFLWTFLEGESFVIIAGAASYKGHLNIYWLVAAAWIGSFCGDQLYFLLGRKLGKRLLRRFPRFQGGVNVALEMLHKYHTLFILTYRYIYGVRNVASFAMGMSKLYWPRFAVLNFIAAGLWANSFAWGGFVLGKAFEAVLGDITSNFGYIMLGVFVFVIAMLTLIHWRSKKRHEKRKATRDSDHHTPLEHIMEHSDGPPDRKPATGKPTTGKPATGKPAVAKPAGSVGGAGDGTGS